MNRIVNLCISAFTVLIISESCTSHYPGTVIAGEGIAVTNTTHGNVAGYIDDGIYTFKGIPYAKAERFLPPEDPDHWEGILPTRQYGPSCPQGIYYKWEGQSDNEFAFRYVKNTFDEDNLFTLNVFSPSLDKGSKKPVFVWLHGGGFSSGSSIDLECYKGYSLAKKGDIVVVTINHRLNCLGFTDLSAFGEKYKYSANAGVMDMVKALEWIRDNISYFGGDPSSVTIAGQSGGGGKVQTLLVTPSAKGLFSRAIVQSGPYGAGHMKDKESSREMGRMIAMELGLSADNIDDIQTVPYDDLLRASRKVTSALKTGGDGPTCSDPTLPYDFFDENAKSLYSDIPLLIGSTFNELGHKLHYGEEIDEQKALSFLTERFGDKAEEFMEEFPNAYPDGTLNDMVSIDINTRKSTIVVADKKHQLSNAPVFMYMFTWKSPILDGIYGSCHNMDLPFMFNNISLQRELTGSGKDAYRLADKMSGAWIAFVKSGNPNSKGLPSWPEYNPEERPLMIFDNKCKVMKNHDRHLLDIAPEKGMF